MEQRSAQSHGGSQFRSSTRCGQAVLGALAILAAVQASRLKCFVSRIVAGMIYCRQGTANVSRMAPLKLENGNLSARTWLRANLIHQYKMAEEGKVDGEVSGYRISIPD